MKKFDIYEVNLTPPKGHRQAGIRPAVIIQSDNFNPYSSTVILVPLTTKDYKVFPGEFWITPSPTNGLTQKSRFLGHQIITIDKQFIGKKQGTLEPQYEEQMKEALLVVLDLESTFG